MKAQSGDIETLITIQSLDKDINRLNKELDSLPQRQIILKARNTRAAIAEKLEKAQKLQTSVKKKLTKIQDEDTSLQKKENGVQAAIEAAGGDFRSVEARTKELNGIFKRRETLKNEMNEVNIELDKVTSIIQELEKAQASNDRNEENATNEFKDQGGKIKNDLATFNSRKESLLLSIDPELANLYKDTVKHVGVITVGKLEGNKCSVCRATIEGGHLLDLLAQAPVGICPSCTRILVIEKE